MDKLGLTQELPGLAEEAPRCRAREAKFVCGFLKPFTFDNGICFLKDGIYFEAHSVLLAARLTACLTVCLSGWLAGSYLAGNMAGFLCSWLFCWLTLPVHLAVCLDGWLSFSLAGWVASCLAVWLVR